MTLARSPLLEINHDPSEDAAASVPETMAAIVNEEPAGFGSGVNPQLQAVVLRCLEKNPERRFHSARDLAFSLRSIAGRAVQQRNSFANRGRGTDRFARGDPV